MLGLYRCASPPSARDRMPMSMFGNFLVNGMRLRSRHRAAASYLAIRMTVTAGAPVGPPRGSTGAETPHETHNSHRRFIGMIDDMGRSAPRCPRSEGNTRNRQVAASHCAVHHRTTHWPTPRQACRWPIDPIFRRLRPAMPPATKRSVFLKRSRSKRAPLFLLGLRAGCLHERRVFADFGLDESLECVGRQIACHRALRQQALGHLRSLQRPLHLGGQALHH